MKSHFKVPPEGALGQRPKKTAWAEVEYPPSVGALPPIRMFIIACRVDRTALPARILLVWGPGGVPGRPAASSRTAACRTPQPGGAARTDRQGGKNDLALERRARGATARTSSLGSTGSPILMRPRRELWVSGLHFRGALPGGLRRQRGYKPKNASNGHHKKVEVIPPPSIGQFFWYLPSFISKDGSN